MGQKIATVVPVDFPTRNKERRVHLVHERRRDTVGGVKWNDYCVAFF